MTWLQRAKDALPAELMRSLRTAKHSGANSLPNALMTIDPHAKVVFDIGANVGDTAQSFLRWFPEATVYAFEPTPSIYAQLTSNVTAAGLADRLVAVQRGLFDQPGEARIHVASAVGATSLYDMTPEYLAANPTVASVADEDVILIRLDDFVAENGIEHIDLVKIDVEGAERAVLLGGEHTFKNRVDAVLMEISFVKHARDEGAYLRLLELMHEYGFAPSYIYDVEQSDAASGWRLAQFDCMFRRF